MYYLLYYCSPLKSIPLDWVHRAVKGGVCYKVFWTKIEPSLDPLRVELVLGLFKIKT